MPTVSVIIPTYNPALMYKEFGFEGKTRFPEGLKRTIEWYKKKMIRA